jgi:hypothetical protein
MADTPESGKASRRPVGPVLDALLSSSAFQAPSRDFDGSLERWGQKSRSAAEGGLVEIVPEDNDSAVNIPEGTP